MLYSRRIRQEFYSKLVSGQQNRICFKLRINMLENKRLLGQHSLPSAFQFELLQLLGCSSSFWNSSEIIE